MEYNFKLLSVQNNEVPPIAMDVKGRPILNKKTQYFQSTEVYIIFGNLGAWTAFAGSVQILSARLMIPTAVNVVEYENSDFVVSDLPCYWETLDGVVYSLDEIDLWFPYMTRVQQDNAW